MSKKEKFVERFNFLIGISKISYAELSRRTGISKSSISDYKLGKALPSTDNAFLIAEVFNVNPAWLLGFDVPMSENKHTKEKYVIKHFVKIPLFDKLPTSFSLETIDYKNCDFFEISLDMINEKTKKEIFAFKITNNVLSPTLVNNDIVLIDTNIKINNGDICLLQLEVSPYGIIEMIKKIEKKNKHIRLTDINDTNVKAICINNSKETNFNIIGKITHILKREL